MNVLLVHVFKLSYWLNVMMTATNFMLSDHDEFVAITFDHLFFSQ